MEKEIGTGSGCLGYSMRKLHFSDHLESEVADTLENAGIDFIHESESKDQQLDFYLPNYDVYIEVKQYHSDRILKQLGSKDNVIVLQGKASISFLSHVLNKKV